VAVDDITKIMSTASSLSTTQAVPGAPQGAKIIQRITGTEFRSEECIVPSDALFVCQGETLRSFTKADISKFQQCLQEARQFKSEVSMEDLQNGISKLSDSIRDIPSQLTSQLENLSRLVSLLSDPGFSSGLKFDARYLADITSQLLMAFQLISVQPTMTNLTLVFTCMLTKLNLSRETLERCVNFINDALQHVLASITSLGYTSEASLTAMLQTFQRYCGMANDMLNDRIIEIIEVFIAKVIAFWTTLSGGFAEEDFNICQFPKIIARIRQTFSEGGDIIQCLLDGINWTTINFPLFIKGDFSGLSFGKQETAAYEVRISKVKSLYPLVMNGSTTILKEEHNCTLSSFDSEVVDLIKTGDKMLKTAKPAQKPFLKNLIDELRRIQIDWRIKQAQVQTKISAIGICFVGGSGVGKSLLMDHTSRTIIRAAGEIPTADKIVTGQMSDKFDSNELPHHLSIQYDDVGNNSNNENFDKLLNAINSQARPFLKADVNEKGIMFPNNLACVISTNVPGYNAEKSNCPSSLGRRFLHIHTKIKDECIAEVCTPGTKRIDPIKASSFGSPRMDIWEFTVYEFLTFKSEMEKGEEIPSGAEVWEGMVVRKLKWTSKPLKEQTYWDLALFLAERSKKHFASQGILLKKMQQHQHEECCINCCIPLSVCTCDNSPDIGLGKEPENFTSEIIDVGIDRLVDHFNTFHDALSNWFDISKYRATFALAYALAPTNHKRNLYLSIMSGVCIGFLFNLKLMTFLTFLCVWSIGSFMFLWYKSWCTLYDQVRTRVGILTHLAENSITIARNYREHIFAGIAMVSFASVLYKFFQPQSQLLSYRETLPDEMRSAFKRAQKARTTPIDNILPHMKRDVGTISITSAGATNMCLTFPIHANFYVTVDHIIPKTGEFEVSIHHENVLTPTVAKQKLSQEHVYRVPNKDLVIINIPSAVPRKGYKDFLLGEPTMLGSQAVYLISMDLSSKVRYASPTRMEPAWSMFSSTISTNKVTLHKPYKYNAPQGTSAGMCGSLIVDYSKAIIYGIHVAGNGKTGLCNTLTMDEVDRALTAFKGFIPLNQGDLQVGSQELKTELGLISLEIDDSQHDKAVEEHNCITEGVLPGQGATFQSPYMKHPFKEAIVAEFGPPKFGPPKEVNAAFHKRKALTKLTSPNQEFSLSELEFAASDYIKPILCLIKKLPSSRREEYARVLSLQEALDGIGEKSLGGIDNSTSCGFPFKGKKKNFLLRDEFDPSIPCTPRELVIYEGCDIIEEMEEMVNRYRSGITARPIFKCSMKTNELLSVEKKKARVFMGCNFAFLLLARRYLAPVIRLMMDNKLLFETSKGINMDSVECEELYNHLKVEEGERVVALDYAAYDQTMSAQASSTAAGIMVDIMRALGCTEDHIQIVRGLLTDITYPNLHYFGTVIQLANSDPSGNPITTELNGMVGSIYLRIFFFRIYPYLMNRIAYRDAIKTSTYGDDNINGVPKKYAKFNGFNIVEEGKKCGLTITMADKDADICEFTHLHESDFLKRKFRYCPDMKRIRAPLAKTSIEKSIHWMKKSSPDKPEILFAQNVDGMLRKASQHGSEYFHEIKGKLERIATKHEVTHLCKWWGYDELIQHDLYNYYTHYKGYSLADVSDDRKVISDFISEVRRSKRSSPFITFIVTIGTSLLLTGLTSIVSMEFAKWYSSGGHALLLKRIADYIRNKYIDMDNQVQPGFMLNGPQGVAEELGIPLFAAQVICFFMGKSDNEPDFKSESFQYEPKTNYNIKGTRLLSFIFEWVLAFLPFVKTGRHSEIGMTSTIFVYGMGLLSAIQTLINIDAIPLVDRTTLQRFGFRIKEEFVKQFLMRNNDLIRKQAFGILLEGEAGAGKTTASLAFVKALLPNIKRSEIIILNEGDEFQSELRSNHKVIILDDVHNGALNLTLQSGENPMRRVIDLINNVPRRALSPDVELKGNIKIQPELVIVTTNMPACDLASWYTCCAATFIRRLERIRVNKQHPFSSGFDTSAWTFEVMQSRPNPSYRQGESGNYQNMFWTSTGDHYYFDQAVKYLQDRWIKHNESQEHLVKLVNDHFDDDQQWWIFKLPTLPKWEWNYSTIFNSFKIPQIKLEWNYSIIFNSFKFPQFLKWNRCSSSEFKSEMLLSWDMELIDKLSKMNLNPDTIRDGMEQAMQELIAEHDIEEFDWVPERFRKVEPEFIPISWYERIVVFLGLRPFRSESFTQYDSPLNIFVGALLTLLTFIITYIVMPQGKKGFATKQLYTDFKDVCVSRYFATKDQGRRNVAKFLLKQIYPKATLIGQSVIIDGLYCDLIFLNEGKYIFLETKSKGIAKAKSSALVRGKYFSRNKDVEAYAFTPLKGIVQVL